MIIFLAYFLSLLIGLTLGLVGSGGSILAVPVLVYVLLIPPAEATAYSLFVVGVSALVGSVQGIKKRLVNLKIALYFGLPSVVTIFLMRKIVMPLLPNILFEINDFSVSKDFVIMFTFALVMLAAANAMIRKSVGSKPLAVGSEQNLTPNFLFKFFNLLTFHSINQINYHSLILKGIFVGILASFVGVGGGFLIVPTLIFAARLPMKNAVATSLLLIACNALIGFLGSLGTQTIDWRFLLFFTAFAVVGILFGQFLSYNISNERLKPAFGWFVLAMGIWVLVKEILF